MRVTLKTGMIYPRHGGTRQMPGVSLDVPKEIAADWVARGIATDEDEWDGPEERRTSERRTQERREVPAPKKPKHSRPSKGKKR